MKITSLMLASSLVMVSIIFSYSQKLKLEKDIIVGVLRAIIQLIVVGYILNWIFGIKSPIFTTMLILVMLFNASLNSAKRGRNIEGTLWISYVAIGAGTFITILILVLAGTISYSAYQIIPVSGMVISNAMVAIGLCYRQLTSDFKNKYMEVETKLALGADILPSSIEIIRDSIRTGMQPTIDSMKTLGVVALPGMMTGLILAGTSPVEAIKYQIMVTFMLLSCTSIASFLACYLSYSRFFNNRKQLIK
ncbi:ABC transporter permease [Fonticella tunisiensis]|uniref:Putative ABC transport system permease protein n=1 Tax=Fonticella tunisiensis TaxID=1096341 RepID=A0A4R7KQU1_9CLOT|nr:iron export ABC transporter permease subunit FetB [Fonticella tunisiensis]TDT60953.1 putative ABC transport system permease protein [Fonticella tunisiensis]